MIICSNEEEDKSHFISKLYHFRRPFVPKISLQEFKDYLAIHFFRTTHDIDETTIEDTASSVDFEQ